jgi:hypothetical protein
LALLQLPLQKDRGEIPIKWNLIFGRFGLGSTDATIDDARSTSIVPAWKLISSQRTARISEIRNPVHMAIITIVRIGSRSSFIKRWNSSLVSDLSFLPFAATFNLNKFKRVALNINQAPEQKV